MKIISGYNDKIILLPLGMSPDLKEKKKKKSSNEFSVTNSPNPIILAFTRLHSQQKWEKLLKK